MAGISVTGVSACTEDPAPLPLYVSLASPTDILERDKVMFKHWGDGWDIDLFLVREATLNSISWAARKQTWVLRAGKLPAEIVANAETFALPSSVNGDLGCSYIITSVFVDPEHRGKRYGSTLIQQLVRCLTEQMPPLAVASAKVQSIVLFSEVGAAFYERLGFLPQLAENSDVQFPVRKEPEYQSCPPGLDAPSHTVIASIAAMRSVLGSGLISKLPEATGLQTLTHHDQLEWHLRYSEFDCTAHGRTPVGVYGCVCAFPSDAFRSEIVWKPVYGADNELAVLHMNAASAEAVQFLMHQALHTAQRNGFSRVSMYKPRGSILSWLQKMDGYSEVERDGALPMVRGIDPAHPVESWIDVQRVTWN
jgi:GNAT superfamily N-acetyltransferase